MRSTTSPRTANFTMLRVISEIAVAMSVWSASENPTRAATSRPRCRASTTSASFDTRMRTTPSVGGGSRRSNIMVLTRAHVGAGQEVTADVQLALSSPVPARQGSEHRPAAVGGWLEVFGHQQVLDAQARAGAAQARGDRARRRSAPSRDGQGVLAVHLVRHEQVPVAGGKVGERGSDDGALLPAQEVGDRRLALGLRRRGGATSAAHARSSRPATPPGCGP